MKHSILCVVAAAPLALPAAADVVSITPSKDNTLYQYSPDDFESPLSNGLGQYLFAGRNASGSARRALIRFDIAAAVPAGATVTGVTLRLNVSQTRAGEEPVALHRLLADWGEGSAMAGGNEGGGAPADPGSATWFARFYGGAAWSNPGGDFAASPSAVMNAGLIGPCAVSGPGLVTDVQAWLDHASSNFGWCLIAPEGEFGTAKRFDSGNNALASVRPTLVIEFTPAAVCVGDYNQDGGVDGSDVEAFFADWENGNGAADLNQDGGVDGADVEFFFAAWEAGC